MTVSRERYTELLNKFRAISEPYITHEVIQRLKEENKKKINSARVLEKINDIKSLLRVLEKRGIVQYNDISALKCIAKDFIKDRSVEELISDYEKWLEENSVNVNYSYSCGKSHTLLNQNDNKLKVSKTENSCDILKNVTNNESEEKQLKCEQCSEPLLPKDPCINIVASNFIQNVNNFKTIINKRDTPNPKRTKKGRIIITLIITLILLILLICTIWFIVKMYYQSTAIIPKLDPGLQTSMEPNRSNMAHYMSSINVGITTQTLFGINQTQNTANTNASARPANVEKDLQDLIIRKISKRIGKFWKDVCRQLNFQEGEILKIESNHSRAPGDFENMFKEALQMYFLDQHPNWRIDLMNALKKSNRTDLKDTVLEILSQKNFE